MTPAPDLTGRRPGTGARRRELSERAWRSLIPGKVDGNWIHPRSGLAARTRLDRNTPGTIDAGYRGEIKVCLINHDPDDHARGDRIAQPRRPARRVA